MKGKMTEKLAALDPERDYQEIAYLLQCHEFRIISGRWNLRCFAEPSIPALLFKTDGIVSRSRKRYDDTELILYEITENGFDSERGQAALKRMNQMHSRFPIANEDFLYMLSTFVFEPIRWLNRYDWRSLRSHEGQGLFRLYCELRRRMHIRDIRRYR